MRSPTPAKTDDAAVQLHHRVHELHDEHGLAHARAAEEPGLAAAHEGAQQVDHLDAGLEHAGIGDGLVQGRGIGEDRPQLAGDEGRRAVERLAEHVEQAPEAFGRNRHAQRAAVSYTGMPRRSPLVRCSVMARTWWRSTCWWTSKM